MPTSSPGEWDCEGGWAGTDSCGFLCHLPGGNVDCLLAYTPSFLVLGPGHTGTMGTRLPGSHASPEGHPLITYSPKLSATPCRVRRAAKQPHVPS